MKENVQDMEMIEKFLDGKLTQEEQIEFEKKRASDKEFSALLKDMDMLVDGIRQSGAKSNEEEKLERLKFFAEVTAMDETSDPADSNAGKVVPLYRKPKVWAAAAGIALLIGVTVVLTRDQTPLHDKLYAAYFEPFDSPGSGLTRGSNEVKLKAKAYDAYDNGRYTEAIPLFEAILKTDDSPILHLCLGNAQMKAGKLAEAESTFSQMLKEHTDLVTQTNWYLALTYLKQNKMERAKATLWEVSKSSTYGEKATQLLKELE